MATPGSLELSFNWVVFAYAGLPRRALLQGEVSSSPALIVVESPAVDVITLEATPSPEPAAIGRFPWEFQSWWYRRASAAPRQDTHAMQCSLDKQHFVYSQLTLA